MRAKGPRSARPPCLGGAPCRRRRTRGNLATSSGGEAKFLAANADLSTEIGAFLAGIASPVLVDATISFPSGGVFDSYPDTPQDLFDGRQLIVLGRYKQGGAGTAEIRGTSGGASETTAFPVALPACAEGAAPFLPRLWAKAKIDALLARIAEGGTEDATTIAQIEELSQQYGIESPYAGFGVSSRPADPSASSSGYGSSSSSSGSSYASGGLEDDEAARRIARTMAFGVATAAAMLAMASRRRRVTARG